MRQVTTSGVTLKYPDAVGFAFNPCLLVADNTQKMDITVSNGTDTLTMTYYGFNGSAYADIRAYIQALFSEKDFGSLTYGTVQQIPTGQPIYINVTATTVGGTEVAFSPITVFYVWGALKIGAQEVFNGYRHLTYFANYPFTLGVYATGATSIKFGNNARSISGEGVWNVVPNIAAGETEVVVRDNNGTVRNVTFDTTFDFTFHLSAGTTNQAIATIKVDREANEGYYLRWLNRQGMWCYWLFKEGAGKYQSAVDGEYWRNNIIAYDQSYGYQGGAVRYQSHNRQEVIPVCVPLVDRETWQYLLDIISSPLVDLYTGMSNGVAQWVSVNVQAGTTTRDMNAELSDFICNIELPETPTQHL